MSNHEIGRGINTITKELIEQYHAGNINKEAFLVLLRTCGSAVNWDDGNSYEALQALVDAGICGMCLNESGDVSNVFENELAYPDSYEVFHDFDKTAAHYFVCGECKKKVIEHYLSLHPDAKRKPL